MTRKSLISGVISGLLLSLALLYPAFVRFVYDKYPVYFDFDTRPAATGPLWLLSLVLAGVALLTVGVLPAMRTHATSWRAGARAGSLSGLIAAFTLFVIIIGPLNAWLSAISLFNYPSYVNDLPPDSVLTPFYQEVLVHVYLQILPVVLAGGVFTGWFIGGLTGALRRDQSEEELTLLTALNMRRGRQRWFAQNDSATRAALLAGVICGGLIVFTSLTSTSSDLLGLGLRPDAFQIGTAIDHLLPGATVPGLPPDVPLGEVPVAPPGPSPVFQFLTNLSNALSPMAVVAFFVFGALAIVFITDPPRWYASRVSAASFAGTVVGALVYLVFARSIYVTIALNDYPGFSGTSAEHWLQWGGTPLPVAVVGVLFIFPLLVGMATILAFTVIGLLQGLVFALILPPIFRRPIDRALSIRSRLREQPAQLLPQLYNTYNQHSDAICILPHLAFNLRRKQTPQARVLAAHHLLSTQIDRAAEAIDVITETLDAQPEWRWRTEVGALYRVMREGLRTRTMMQLAAIEPLGEVQTSTLPLMLSRAGELLGQILTELRKVERVDDLNSKIIFLNNTLDAIRVARRHAEAMKQGWISSRSGDPGEPFRQVWKDDPRVQEVRRRFEAVKEPEDFKVALQAAAKVPWGNNVRETFRLADEMRRDVKDRHAWVHTAYPEAQVIDRMLDQWEGLVLNAVKDLQGRAAVVSELKTKQLNYSASVPVTLSIRNDGFNIAESVRLIVNEGEGYRVTAGAQHTIDILTAKAARDVEVTIEPQTRDRVRLSWRLQYDDAVDKDRTVEFADVLEFIGGEQDARPFVRIFPIPYVTGMPLKTDHLFVGRADVFAYIQEHLFGAYQNNVIVLHGQRRTGKTSILYRLKKVMAGTHVAVLVDMQGKAARGNVDFLYSLADDIAYELEEQGVTVDLPPRSDFADSPEFFFRSRFLRRVYEVLPPIVAPSVVPGADAGAERPPDGDGPERKHLLLMFDEFEELQKRVEDGKLEAEVFPFLRNLMQHEEPLDFVFAGTHKLEELGAEYWSILFNIASYKKITFLSHDDAQRLITEPVSPNLEFDPLAIERIIGVTGGHPYFTQVVCHELVSYHNETQRGYLTANDVEDVLDRIVERGEAHFKFIWAESSANERLVLLALADLLETAETASADDVQASFDKRACCLSESAALPQVLDRLEMGDILTRSGTRSNLYRFKIDLIRRWIYATRPV